jgi:hypothetical protein
MVWTYQGPIDIWYRLIEIGAVPTFTETSSPELDSLLSVLRSKLMLPAHLSKQQTDLIHKPKHKRLLSAEPVTAQIAGEEFQLEHIDIAKDVPAARRALNEAINLMKEKRDWDNLPSILEGFKNAKARLLPYDWNKMVRKAGLAGRSDVILECVRRVSATGFRLKHGDLVSELMWQLQIKAVESDWSQKQTGKALSWAERITVLLEDPRHSGGRVVDPKDDPRAWPEVIGILLQLAAVRAARYLGCKDEDGKVTLYAERLLGTSLDVKMELKDPDAPPTAFALDTYLARAVPVLYGMKVSQTVLDPTSKIATELNEKSAELEATISTRRDILAPDSLTKDGRLRRGFSLYERLLGPEAI